MCAKHLHYSSEFPGRVLDLPGIMDRKEIYDVCPVGLQRVSTPDIKLRSSGRQPVRAVFFLLLRWQRTRKGNSQNENIR